MTSRIRTALFAVALASSTAIIVAPLIAQQASEQKTGSSKSSKTSAVKQEFGPQSVPRRGDRMGVVANSSGSGNSSTSSHSGKQNNTQVKRRKVNHSKSDHVVPSAPGKTSSK